MRFRSKRDTALLGLVSSLALVGAAGVAAQSDATSQPSLDLSGAIHQGTCEAPGASAFQVGDFIRIQESEIVGSTDVAFNLRAQQTLQADFDDLFGEDAVDHVFLVVDNTDPQGDPIACGALGGARVNGQVVIGLAVTDDATGDEELAGVAIFGNTTPSGPTTQPAQTPGQLPVQAYVSEDALTPDEPTPAVITPTRTAPASPTAAPSTPVPTQEPTAAPTESPTIAPTEQPTEAPTETPTQAPTEAPTQEPTEAPPTEEPTQEVPPTSDATVT